jgi:alanine dehydrogenase
MLVGVPKEIKTHEYRVGLAPGSVREIVHNGHEVIVETRAGAGIGFDDDSFRAAGAQVVDTADEVFSVAEMIVKVKEPQPEECAKLRAGQVLFTYLHLAADRELTEQLLASGCVGIAYETVTGRHRNLPLLAPMSEVAGRMSIQVGAHYLEKEGGGAGVLLGGVPGVEAGRVCVIGGGVSGINAARMAMGLEAKVTVLERSLSRLDVCTADLVIGAVLVPGGAAPKLVTEEMVRKMQPGAVMVDIAIDQGGCFETSRPTTHADPVYKVHDVVHYCVTNMPGAVARTSTQALNNATLPYVLRLANDGYRQALGDDPDFREGLNVHEGKVTYEAVAQDLGLDYTPAEEALRL